MKRLHKILFAFTCFALLLLVGYFAFGAPGLAHAQDLHTDLVRNGSSQTWIFEIWKVALALANVIVIVMLLFVAIVNIVHLQYDTYAIKKSLPLLIIGVIMANFSLLICRMIVDAAQVLANTFAGDPRALAEGLLCSMGFATTHSSISVLLLSATGLSGIAIILMIILMLVILIAVVILAFLLWMRKFVIFLLVAVAPIAFILYAFPPTQNLFKKWWSWFLTWTFMGPLVMLLVWAASKIGATNCTAINGNGNFNISALFATVGVIYLAAIVPFKLGGPVMGAWGKAGQWLTGTGKTGFARKPVDEWMQRRKDQAGAALKRVPGVSGLAWRGMRDRELTEAYKKDTENTLKLRAHGDNKYAQKKAQAANSENKAKELDALQTLGVKSGNYNANFGLKTTENPSQLKFANDLKSDIHNTESTLQRALKGVTKDSDWALFNALGKDMEDANVLSDRMEKEFNVLTDYKVNENGTLSDSGEKTHYGKLKQLRDQLSMRYDTEENENAKANLLNSMNQIDKTTNGFEKEHPNLNFGAYLNKNLTGRQLALITPLLMDEAKTNADSMSVQEFKQALFGNKGGGFGDVKYGDNGTIKDLIQQRYGARNHREKSAGLATLLGAVNRAEGTGTDAQDMLKMVLTGIDKGHTFTKDVDGFDFKQEAYAPGYWQEKLAEIDKERPGSVKAALKEYNVEAQKRGGNPLGIIDFDQAKSIKGMPDNERRLIRHIDDMTDEEAQKLMPVDIIGAINTNDPSARAQRFIYGQIRSKVSNEPRFVRDRNPATRIGDISMPGEKQAGQTGSTPAIIPPGPNPFQNYQNVQNFTQELSSTSPDQISQIYTKYGGPSKMVEQIFQSNSASDINSCLQTMRAGLAQKLIPQSLAIDLSSEGLNKLISHLSNLDANVNINHDQLEQELKGISPEIAVSLDRNMPVSNYISEAQKVKRGTQNVVTIVEDAAAEEIEPYAKHMEQKDNNSLNEYLTNIESAMNRLAAATEHAQDQIATGGKNATIDPEAIKQGVEAAQKAKGGDVPLNVEKYSGDNPTKLIEELKKLRTSIQGTINYKNNPNLQSSPDGLRIALREAVKEGMGQTSQTPPAPTPPSTPSPGAPIG